MNKDKLHIISKENWEFEKNVGETTLYTHKNFVRADKTPIELLVIKKEKKFLLSCFSKYSSSCIVIEIIDFPKLWKEAENYSIELDINSCSFEEQCMFIADYLSAIFCQKVTETV